MASPSAVIAEDEPLLAAALQAELLAAWPGLQIAASVGDGISAVQAALEHLPDVLFFDIRMPGLDGLDAASDIADQWPINDPLRNPRGKPLPQLVFVTAYDQYAVQAFERCAVDYVLKPVQSARLQQTIERIARFAGVSIAKYAIDTVAVNPLDNAMHPAAAPLLAQLQALLQDAASQPVGAIQAPLQHIQASVGSSIHMVPLGAVLVFEAADKYVRVLTTEREYLIRTPIKDLLPQLPAAEFWQIHRSTLVRASAIAQATRDEAGRLWLQLHGCSERLSVSRLYAYLFKSM